MRMPAMRGRKRAYASPPPQPLPPPPPPPLLAHVLQSASSASSTRFQQGATACSRSMQQRARIHGLIKISFQALFCISEPSRHAGRAHRVRLAIDLVNHLPHVHLFFPIVWVQRSIVYVFVRSITSRSDRCEPTMRCCRLRCGDVKQRIAGPVRMLAACTSAGRSTPGWLDDPHSTQLAISA